LTPGAYEIRGRVASFRDGELQVVAGKKITGKVAGDAKIAVNVHDISFIQQEDPIKYKAYYLARFAPNASAGRPGTATGIDIEVTIANPLKAVAKKSEAKRTKRAKDKQTENAPIDAGDPFGFKKADEQAK
jgi:hypothetical protein